MGLKEKVLAGHKVTLDIVGPNAEELRQEFLSWFLDDGSTIFIDWLATKGSPIHIREIEQTMFDPNRIVLATNE
jgi:hypothetical protein